MLTYNRTPDRSIKIEKFVYVLSCFSFNSSPMRYLQYKFIYFASHKKLKLLIC